MLASRVASWSVDALFVTSLGRTVETAGPLLAGSGLDPVVVDSLREYELGDYDGPEFERRRQAGDPALLSAMRQETWEVLPGAEADAAFRDRVAAGLDEVVRVTGPDALAVVVTHAVVIAEACRSVTGSRPFAFLGVENASLTGLLRLGDGSWRLRSFNDTQHLGAGVLPR